VAGLQKMGALKKKVSEVKWRSAGDPSHQRIMPGGTEYEAVTLEQGLTHDPVFENWANLVNNIQGDGAISLVNYRKDIVINVLNLQGVVAISYKLFRAWVSEYQALPEFDANTMNTVGIQTLTLQHEGWERDTAVTEPSES
nr:phage tail protein [Gammaproteobacteria bacterium]